MGMSEPYPHLHASARPLAEENTELRIRRIRTDRWIAYARAEAALSAMEDLLSFPKRLRMPNLVLVGPTNNGKTMIIDKFRRDHPPIEARATREGVANVPVLKVQMPSAPDERRFFGTIVEALGMPDRPNDRIAAKQEIAVRLMRATKVRLLLIDEVHNVLSGSRNQQRRFLNLLRWLGNELQIPLVAVGTAEGLRAIQSDEQLANRFEPFALPPWRDGEEYRRLLSTLEAILPLRRPSRLAEPAMAGKILSAAEGILGEIVAVVARAAVQAVTTGAEVVSAEMIDGTGFIPPSKRRRVAI
jgi:Bacterial TniB protein